MTGGCPNHEFYLDDKTYCTPQRLRALRERNALRGSTQRGLLDVNDPANIPLWGIQDDKLASESNFVMCAMWPKAPELPKKCASLWGDPHVSLYW